jgi:hypothetical protein
MTKQHVFSKRLLALLDEKTGSHLVVEHDPSGKITKKKEGHIWSKQMRRVCKTCNGGWMRALEESTFPLLKDLIGGETLIQQSAHGPLSARLALIATVGGLANDVDAIGDDERRYFRDNVTPPLHWRIFLARADNPSNVGQFFNADAFYASKTSDAPHVNRRGGVVITFVLGKLCVHFLTLPRNPNGYVGVHLAQLWPIPKEDIVLTEASLLGRPMIVALAMAIGD